jgi:hypothetical protein
MSNDQRKNLPQKSEADPVPPPLPARTGNIPANEGDEGGSTSTLSNEERKRTAH